MWKGTEFDFVLIYTVETKNKLVEYTKCNHRIYFIDMIFLLIKSTINL